MHGFIQCHADICLKPITACAHECMYVCAQGYACMTALICAQKHIPASVYSCMFIEYVIHAVMQAHINTFKWMHT